MVFDTVPVNGVLNSTKALGIALIVLLRLILSIRKYLVDFSPECGAQLLTLALHRRPKTDLHLFLN